MEKLSLCIAVFLGVLFLHVSAQGKAPELKDQASRKVLVVYLSRTYNTKALAEIIHKKVGGDLVGLALENPYPKNYQQTVDQVAEENRTNLLPKLKTKIDHIDQYNTIFIGFPTWGMQLPPP